MVSAETEAWRVREGAEVLSDTGREEAEWDTTAWERTRVWR